MSQVAVHFPRRWLALILIAVGIMAPRGPACIAATPEQVDTALDSAVKVLFSRQSAGIWETHPPAPTKEEIAKEPNRATAGQWAGDTALAVYALLAAGISPSDPRLEPAIKFLRKADIKGAYALGMRSQIYPFLPTSKDVKLEARADVTRYENAMITQKPAIGLFDYLLDSKRYTRFDHSVSQYGVLGAWACERAGAEVPTLFWQTVEDAWIRDQAKDGSWSYSNVPSEKYPSTASMTMAGVATLFITLDYVHADNGIKCSGNVTSPHIDLGIKWISNNFEHVFTDKTINAPYYALYGVERVGVASGRKYLGSVNWYQRGSDFLIKNQQARGGWGATTNTCFGILFLSRGRAPVAFNKLQYDLGGKEGNWNERPRDIANLTRWIGRKIEKDLNWQIVNLKGSVDELLDAPVLYISGDKPLIFSAAEENLLREFCEAGGIILGNPDCGKINFADSFKKLGVRLFPSYEFRELPASHPIYTSEQFPRKGWKAPPALLGLSNGVRELMLLTPTADPAKHWQLEEGGRFDPDFELADNIFLYAVDKKNLSEKGKTYFVRPQQSVVTNREIRLARLQYNGNWDPEPGGWRRMAAILQNSSHIKLNVTTVKLGSGELGDGKSGPTVATLTGTTIFKLDQAGRQEIKNFLEGNGTLIVDAAGGASDFASSVENELQTILGNEAGKDLKVALPPSAPIFNMPGGVIGEFNYRTFARSSVGTSRAPRLAIARIGDRRVVYYSRMDLSTGVVGQSLDGIIGYEPATATAIMINLVIAGGLGEHEPVSPTK